MKVKLLQITPNALDIMYTAARTCYSSKSPIEIFNEGRTSLDFDYNTNTVDTSKDPGFTEGTIQEDIDKKWNLVKKVLDSGHQSIAEHIYFTFAIEGISRACSHQLVRHRAGIVFSQQSQRYVEIKEDYTMLKNLYTKTLSKDDNERKFAIMEATKIVDKYFVTDSKIGVIKYFMSLTDYLQAIKNGSKPEDARMLLPNATKTNIVMSCNYRQLIHMCNLRLCTRAQQEIRNLFKEIVNQVKERDERLAVYLVPSCEYLGACVEAKSCKRKPLLKDILVDYNNQNS